MDKTQSLLLAVAAGIAFPSLSSAETYLTKHYEAEALSSQFGSEVDNRIFPYVGDGYAVMAERESFIEWDQVEVPESGNYTLIVKYANASGRDRPCAVSVNGETVETLVFKSVFDDWHYYWNARVTIPLSEGANTIRLSALTAAGGPHIDNIAISRSDLTTAPGKRFNVRDYGARGDAQANDTGAIQAAIDACTPGGSVVLDEGVFMAGYLRLKSDMTFWISQTATLKAIQDESLFPFTDPPTANVSVADELGKSFLYSEGANNLTITGGGVIDGNAVWENWDKETDESVRPVPIYTTMGQNIKIAHLDLLRSAMWNVVPLECDDVIIDDLNIYSNWPMNKDGIDPCDSHRVLITNSTLTLEDDALCPKSGHTRGCVDITYRNITVNETICGGIKLGTKSYGVFKNLVFEDIAMLGKVTHKGSNVGINLSTVDGAEIENVTVRRVNMRNFASAVFILHGAGQANRNPEGSPEKRGDHVRNILIEDIDARACHDPFGNFITGTKVDDTVYTVQNVTLRDVVIEAKGGLKAIPEDPKEYSGQYPNYDWPGGALPAWGFYIRHAEEIRFENCQLTVSPKDVRQEMVLVNTRNIKVE